MSEGSIGLLYLDRFSDADLATLSAAAGETGGATERVSRLHADPGRIAGLVEEPVAFDTLFGPRADPGLVFASPHLAFSVLLSKVARELGEVAFVREWVAPRRSVPLFDVMALRAFVEDRMRRLFLADVLASYTHVASGRVWTRSGRRWTRRRFSELDPLHLIRLIEATPEHEHPVLYRRLGDLSLFLSGVFPDHAATRLFGAEGRVDRFVAPSSGLGPAGPIELLERLGQRAYRMVSREDAARPAGMGPVLDDVAKEFSEARRVLNFLTERHLFGGREAWFDPGVG